jgi:hypothetical protein
MIDFFEHLIFLQLGECDPGCSFLVSQCPEPGLVAIQVAL